MNRLPAVFDGSGRSSDMKVSPAAAATPVPSWTASASASRCGNARQRGSLRTERAECERKGERVDERV